MKKIIISQLLLALASLPLTVMADGIAIISNVYDNKILVAENFTTMTELDLKTDGRKAYSLPKVEGASLLALFLDKDKTISVFQKIHEGGENPMVYVYDKPKASWDMKGEIECPSFNKVYFAKSKFFVECELISPDKDTYDYKKKEVKMKGFSSTLEATFSLPILATESADYKLSLSLNPTKLTKSDKKLNKTKTLDF